MTGSATGRHLVAALLGTLGIAACGSGGSTSSTSSDSGSPPSASSTVAVPSATPGTGPPTAQFTLAGGSGLAGPLTVGAIRCSEPSLGGLYVGVDGTAAGSRTFVRVSLSPGSVAVKVAAGSGAQYTERDFTGSGVTAFNAAVGGTVDSPVTEATPSGLAAGTLGAFTSIIGKVDCGNQQPGTSTITITGDTASGRLSGALNPVRVECQKNPNGDSVFIVGLSHAGSTPAFLEITVSKDVVMVYEVVQGTAHTYVYSGKAPGYGTLKTGGAHAAASVAEAIAGDAPHTLNVTGDATCGTTVTT